MNMMNQIIYVSNRTGDKAILTLSEHNFVMKYLFFLKKKIEKLINPP